MINRDVEKDAPLPLVYGIDQLLELLQWRRFSVKLSQRGIDFLIVLRCVRAAITPHSRIGRRRRMNWQQLNDAEAHFIHDDIERIDKISEFAGGRQHRVALIFKVCNFKLGQFVQRPASICAELAHKRAIHHVRLPRIRRFHLDDHIVAFGPLQLAILWIQMKALGIETTYFAQRIFKEK